MEPERFAWQICVVSGFLKDDGSSQLANAILYGDEVIWLPTALPAIASIVAYHWDEPGRSLVPDTLVAMLDEQDTRHKKIIGDIRNLDIPFTIPDRFLQNDAEYIEEALRMEFRALFLEQMRNPRVGKNLGTNLEFDEFNSLIWDLAQKRFYKDKGVEELLSCKSEIVRGPMDRAHATILDGPSPFDISTPARWQTYQAAQALMNALSRVFFPDVSKLPLAEVRELRQHVSAELEPFRAEMLRLTEDLRTLVGTDGTPEALALEAENLIKTRVEPAVREARIHTQKQIRTRWRRYLRGGLELVALGALGILSVDYAKAAIQKAVALGADAATEKREEHASAAARLTLQLRKQSLLKHP